ncbi:MAG: RluA family pseudouridine synthase [Clostridiaceae bacterium]|jgi:23S rRNA pseudouridine1911/1915/1917 synthase|nr:RluA family pseudouridine synthase [Clostridiaceae bacterium]
MRLSIIVSAKDKDKSVKQLLKGELQLSERLVKQLKLSGKILLNSVPVHVNRKVSEGDLLEALVEFDECNDSITPEPMDLDILYEDETLIAINKPPDMVVHPTFRHQTGTVANGLMHHLLEKGIKTLVRPVSRLDRNTSGIILFALNPYIQECLIRQMHDKTFIKEYIGIVHGTFSQDKGTINLPIQRLEGSIMLRHTTQEGLPSVTHYEVQERFSDSTCLKFVLETGRTHQIRVHCQAIGHPLIGDTLYPLPALENDHKDLIPRHCLHSHLANFTHPYAKMPLEIKAPIPQDIIRAMEILRNN